MMRFALALSVSLAATAAPAWADDDDEEEDVEEEGDDEEDEESDEDEEEEGIKPAPKPKAKAKAKAKDEDEEEAEETEARPFKKQNLTGHDTGDKKANLFEKDRFFVDKVDTEKTEKGTLVQGSLTSTSFAYTESGGTLPPANAQVPSNSQFSRFFTDLRLQTDFRHISGGKWDARVDVRGRFVNDPGQTTPGYTSPENSDSRVQSGLLGENELEIRELWIIRSGKRSDFFLGRQFVPDLAAVKFDGIRIDYASSSKLTYLAFGGLFPIRGSRSLTTDYAPLYAQPAADGTRASAGRLTGVAGFGAAYRTTSAYGAFGGVTQVPFKAEAPRVFGTATGYLRAGPKLDFYHFAVIDVIGSNAVNAGITNLSLGANYKPDQRLRATAAFHRVDTETLNVQAQAFLNDPDRTTNVLQNEAYLYRVAQNQVRGSLSAGLGSLQRFELTTQLAFRFRSSFTLTSPGDVGGMTTATLPAGKSVEVYGAIQDRRSLFKTRIGVDGSRVFRVGDYTYQRARTLAFRGFVARELANGHGEWEVEVAYAQTKDDNLGTQCNPAFGEIRTCYGAARSAMISIGGGLFYRVNRDWFVMGNLYASRNNLERNEAMVITKDPNVTGFSGFGRIAYRF